MHAWQPRLFVSVFHWEVDYFAERSFHGACVDFGKDRLTLFLFILNNTQTQNCRITSYINLVVQYTVALTIYLPVFWCIILSDWCYQSFNHASTVLIIHPVWIHCAASIIDCPWDDISMLFNTVPNTLSHKCTIFNKGVDWVYCKFGCCSG